MPAKIKVKVDEDLAEFIPSYLESRLKDIKTIQELLQKKDFSPIQRIAHGMKGSGGGYGFDFISKVGLEMEAAAMKQEQDKIIPWLDKLADYLALVEIEYVAEEDMY